MKNEHEQWKAEVLAIHRRNCAKEAAESLAGRPDLTMDLSRRPDCTYFGGNEDPSKCSSTKCPRHRQHRAQVDS